MPHAIQEFIDAYRREVEAMSTEEFRAEARRRLASMPGFRFDIVRQEYESRLARGLIGKGFPNDRPKEPPEVIDRWQMLMGDGLDSTLVGKL